MPGKNLSLMLLPQRWDGANLIANLLLLPNGDPTAPVPIISGHELPFSQAQPVLRAALLPGLATPPWAPSVSPVFVPITLTYSSAEPPIFAALAAQYTPTVPGVVTQPGGIIRKDLPESFMAATGFAGADPTYFTSVDGFNCAIGASTPDVNQTPSYTIAWGEILSYALRQPLICQAMGLAYLEVSIPLDANHVSGGGWIWLEIDTTNPNNWYAKLVTEQPGAVSTYAARLPALTTAQDVFAAVLFPTVPGAYDAATMAAAQFEADLYLDGFAKVVHASQPTTSDSVTGQTDTIVPGTDAGIQIGWDDTQVTTWVNRRSRLRRLFPEAPQPRSCPLPSSAIASMCARPRPIPGLRSAPPAEP